MQDLMILKLDNGQVSCTDIGDKEINQKCCKVIKGDSERTYRKREKVYILWILKFNVFYAYSTIIYCSRKIVFDSYDEAIVKLLNRSESLSTAFDINPHLFGGV